MAFAQSDLDAIRAVIARGELTVQFSDRMVVYRSMDQLLLAERHIAGQLSGRPKQSLAVADKGLTNRRVE